MGLVFDEKRKRYRVSVGSGRNRKRLWFKHRIDAEKLLARAKKKSPLKKGPTGTIRISDAVEYYHKSVSSGKDSATFNNESRYFSVFRYFFEHTCRLTFLDEIELEHLEEFRRFLSQGYKFNRDEFKDLSPLKPATINRWFHTIGHFFSRAQRFGWIIENPCLLLESLEEDEVFRRQWSDEAIVAVRENCPDWFVPVFDFIHDTGARPSSVERITWQHVDLARRFVFLTSKKGRKAKLKHFPVPLGEKSLYALRLALKRVVGMPGILAQPVFVNSRGQRLTADLISKVASKAIKAAGHEGLELYTLRHKLASDLAALDVGNEKIGRILGHADARATKAYLRFIPDLSLKESINRARGGTCGTQSATAEWHTEVDNYLKVKEM